MSSSIALDLFEGQISQIFTYLCTYMLNGACMERELGKTFQSEFSHVWVLGIELRSLGLGQASLLGELSCPTQFIYILFYVCGGACGGQRATLG